MKMTTETPASITGLGPANQTVAISETLLDSKSLFLTANDNTVYSLVWLDMTKGPLVLEVPPMVLGPLDDYWFRWVTDVGITGPDKGKGGKVSPPAARLQGPDPPQLLCRPFAHLRKHPFLPHLSQGRRSETGG
jgi:hypothetical protein